MNFVLASRDLRACALALESPNSTRYGQSVGSDVRWEYHWSQRMGTSTMTGHRSHWSLYEHRHAQCLGPTAGWGHRLSQGDTALVTVRHWSSRNHHSTSVYDEEAEARRHHHHLRFRYVVSRSDEHLDSVCPFQLRFG